ncbi:hypothetical protein LXM25_20700 [Dyadobacter sp. LJ53]|uniref:hypothetical protein n=1 Tax=Dyadobacter chenwenxiniae TaxID=2906456 RepID=UPI001F18E8F5|nr:hypothetical protein [Dyadobacter chenwenxiniae]MCF0052502.1 hypothetical protein [Dyadobacter chenwenxiniae]
MKQTFYVIISIAFLFWQCRKEDDPIVTPVEIKEIDVLDFSVPGIDKKNITVGENLIVVHLPEHYSKGNFIKPDVIFGSGYSSQSALLNGISFEGQEIRLELESTTRERRNFDVIVIPYKAIQLNKPVQNYHLKIGPDVTISTSFDLKGTKATVDVSGKIVRDPLIRLTDKTTGRIAKELYADESYANSGNKPTYTLPPSVLPGEYIAEIVWGAKTELLSAQIKVSPGAIQFKRGSWQMQGDDRYFEIVAYNLSLTAKYEAIIQNDFIAPQRLSLKYEGPGTLSGNLPTAIGLGNYKITYLLNGKEQKPFEERFWLDRYSGDDHFYVRKHGTQPILRIVTQPSLRNFFATPLIEKLPYYPSTNEINRNEPILAYTQAWGPFPAHNELILVNQHTGAKYALPYSGDIYGMFDYFITLLAYPIPDTVPDGRYTIHVIRGTERTERYSQIITLK